MIVLSNSLVLEEPTADFGPDNPVIGWNNIVTPTGIKATSEVTGFLDDNLGNPSTAELWKASSTADQDLTTLNVPDTDLDYVGIAKHNFGTAESTIQIEGYTTLTNDIPDWTELVQDNIPADDCPLIYRFTKDNYLGIRVRIKSNSAIPQAAVLYIGELLIMERRIYVGHTPMPYGRQTSVENNRSQSGNFLGNIVTNELLRSTASFQRLTPSWYREKLEPFAAQAMENPFFWAWKPLTYPNEVGYAWLNSDIRPSNQFPNGMMEAEIDMTGIGCR